MAKSKSAIVQKDFALGETRPESIERDDTDLLNRSVQGGRNTIISSTGTMGDRPGTFYLQTVPGEDGIEIEPASGVRYVLVPIASGLRVFDSTGALIVEFTTATWTLAEDIWINNLGDTILLGSQESPIHALTYEDGAFTFGLFSFAEGVGGSLNQPYWAFEKGITLTPSALTGSITLTTDVNFFAQGLVGQRIRYVEREIEITSVTDGMNAAGTVISELPPTKDITVADASGFQVGEAVEHQTLGGQGLVTAIAGNVITVLVTKFFTGFNGTGANLVAPNAKSNISAVADASSPAGTTFWDEPLISPTRGYPGGSASHEGRVCFNDFPEAPNVFAASATGTLNDLLVGTNDDDAIVDTISASRAARILHVVSAEDLIFLTSDGCYYQETRDGTPLTPDAFRPKKFDSMGASPVRPTAVHDGVVFIGANGQNVYGAILQGDIYKAWSVAPLSEFHDHLVNSPVRLTATENDSDRPERFVFVINGDGTAAIMRWERGPAYSSETVGWVPWDTDGTFLAMFMAFGQIHTLVTRSGSTFLERFDDTAQLDSATGFNNNLFVRLVDDNGFAIADDNGDVLVGVDATAAHLAGRTAAVWLNDYDEGDYLIGSNGLPQDSNGDNLVIQDGSLQVGLPFTMEIKPWSRRSTEGYGGRREAQRICRFTIGIQDTISFTINDEPYAGYRSGESLASPPERRTEHVHFYPATRDHYPDIVIKKDRPGPFRMTAMIFEVQL